MLNAVWVAVIVAVACWAAVAAAAVFLMVRASRLVAETTTAVTAARERSDLLAEQASALTHRASEQVAKTESITASMEDVAATMAELNGRLTALAPAARTIAEGVGVPLARAAAVVYGVNKALGVRRAPRTPVVLSAGRHAGRRRVALAGRRGGGAAR